MKYQAFIFCIGRNFETMDFQSILSGIRKFSDIKFSKSNINWNPPKQYIAETGDGLNIKLLVLSTLLDLHEIGELKSFLMTQETATSTNGKRNYNLNPGYISQSGVFALTHKPNKERGRKKLQDGIWIEKQLDFINGQYKPNQYTFTEYATTVKMFNAFREKLTLVN